MTDYYDVDEIAGGKGAPSWGGGKTPVNDVIKGMVLEVKGAAQTNIKGETLFFRDGKPRTQIIVTIQSDKRDPENPDDDGIRRVFLKGGAEETEPYSQHGQPGVNAVKAALEPLKLKMSQLPGCEITIKKGEKGRPPEGMPNGTNLYKVKIVPGVLPKAEAVDPDDF